MKSYLDEAGGFHIKESTLLNCRTYGDEIGDGDVLIIGFATDEDCSEGLTFSFARELTNQDREFGWTRYYLERSNFGGEYGCIEAVYLHNDRICVVLNSTGQEFFETGSFIHSLDIEPSLQHRSTELLKDEFLHEDEVILVDCRT